MVDPPCSSRKTLSVSERSTPGISVRCRPIISSAGRPVILLAAVFQVKIFPSGSKEITRSLALSTTLAIWRSTLRISSPRPSCSVMSSMTRSTFPTPPESFGTGTNFSVYTRAWRPAARYVNLPPYIGFLVSKTRRMRSSRRACRWNSSGKKSCKGVGAKSVLKFFPLSGKPRFATRTRWSLSKTKTKLGIEAKIASWTSSKLRAPGKPPTIIHK